MEDRTPHGLLVMFEIISDALTWGAALRPAQWTEMAAASIASFAIVGGIGTATVVGYLKGRCEMPRSVALRVNTPFAFAMLLRIVTFLLDGKYYWFLIAMDAVGFLLGMIILGQTYGFFLRRQTVEEPAD